MLYATAAKGFRPAGASLRAPAICDEDLITNGYVDAAGNPVQPTSYKSDSLWSYELGAKSRLWGGRLALDGSVYEIKWKNIQVNVPLPDCAYNFVDNLADATSRGFDLGFDLKATEHLDLSGAVGYNNPKFDKDALSPGGVPIYRGGSSIPDAGPPVSASVSAEYSMPMGSGHVGYARVDYTYTTEWRRFGTDDPGTPNYDSAVEAHSGVRRLQLAVRRAHRTLRRVGLRAESFGHRAGARAAREPAYYDPQDWQNVTLRPRTYGLTAIWRN